MNLLRVLLQPFIDATHLAVEWNRYWCDHAEHVADAIEHPE